MAYINDIINNELDRLNFISNTDCSTEKKNKLLKYIIDNPCGGTVENWEIVEHSTGYQVAITGGTDDNTHRFETFDAAVEFMITVGGSFGYWKSDDTGDWCIDISLYITDKDAALEIGRMYKQESIFDWETFDCIGC